MSVGILLITHDMIGTTLLQSARAILGVCPLPATNLSVSQNSEPEQLLNVARQAAQELDSGAGVLVLTDLYGATPSNVASRLQETGGMRVIAGLNLPMLIRVLNYPDLDLDELAGKAVSGGRDGVLTLEKTGHA
ncbi:MAG: PTS fructose transporter subunit IIA [Thiogranum sp.]|nr:PTS fructose transporter subunit IIA [Thiogranum sp.]